MRHLRARRWLTVPVAALTVLGLGAFGGDKDDKKDQKDKHKGDDAKVLIDEEFVDDSNGWGGESTPALEVGVDEETDTFDWLVYEDIDFFVEYYPDALLPKADKLRDVRVEGDVSFTTPGVAGLTCRVADPAGQSGNQESYIFAAEPDGHVSIAKRLEDGVVEFLDESEIVFDAATVAEGFMHLGAECVGGKGDKPVTLTMSVEGVEILEVKDKNGFTQGGTHLFGAKSADAIEANGFAPFAIVWDTFKVTEL